MTRTLMIGLALTITAIVQSTFADDSGLPKSAKVTVDDTGTVIGVQLTGKSNVDRLAVSPQTIDAISKLTTLRTLSLWGTTAGDDDIKRLTTLENLQSIDLTFTDVTGDSLRPLSSLKQLVSVRLEGCDVRDGQLAALSEMPQLAILYLGRTRVTDAGLRHLRGLRRLNLLQLSDCKISDSGLTSLGDLPQIQHLWLSKTIRYGEGDRSDFTDECIEYLASLDTLIDLRIADSKLTEQGLNRLREALPKTKLSTERTGITYLNRNEK